MKVCSYINTYNRTDTLLPMAILSILNQTIKPQALIIFDENKEFKNPLENTTIKYLLDLSVEKGIPWFWLPGDKKGAHHNHEKANIMKDYDLFWFLDDDQVAQPDCLEKLLEEMRDGVGAVAGLILKTPTKELIPGLDGTLKDVWSGQNLQWYRWSGDSKETEHLYSSFLYRGNISHFDLRFSKKSFRCETQFTHSLFLKGYKLIVTPKAITWHFEGDGGCRSEEEEKSNLDMYNSDNKLFIDWLKTKQSGKKIYVLNGGVGDCYMFLQAIEPEPGSIIACCYPECFDGKDVKIISIAEAKMLVDDKDYDIYKWCHENKWKGNLIGAYKALYTKMYENFNR